MEILDSRYVGFKYFSLPDVIADNSSSSQFVLGTEVVAPRALDLAALEMVMSVDGQPVERALSSAISGDPVVSVVQLCELLAARGLALPAGSVVLAGAATTAVQLAVGQRIELAVSGLGVVRVDVAS
jgi:2-oxo-3-hexenedioate decarboxylase